MTYVAEIVLPSGTRTVEVSDIPVLFADAIQPRSSSNARVVSDLKKQLLDQAGLPLPGLHPLTSDPLNDYNSPEQRLLEAIYVDEPGKPTSSMTDWALLNLAWSELPTFRFPLPESEWSAYQAALENLAPMLDWALVPEWDSDNGHTFILNLRAQVAHRSQLRAAIEAGTLVPLSPITLLPVSPATDTQLDNCFVTVDGLREYAARFHIGVQVAGLEPQIDADINEDDDDGYKHQPFTPLFEAYFNLPLCAIPPRLMARAKKIGFLDSLWDESTPEQRRDLVATWDYQNDPKNQGLFQRDWWDQNMDASLWWGRTALTPHEAAAILCRHNPLNMKPGDPESNTSDETGPADYKRLLRVFEDVQHTLPQHRSLSQWLSVARANRLRYHSWIDEWLQGGEGEHQSDLPSAIVAHAATLPISRTTAQNEAILAEIRSCNYDPLKLQKAPAGKAGVKAEIRERLTQQTSIFISPRVFNDAWQRLRDEGLIRDA